MRIDIYHHAELSPEVNTRFRVLQRKLDLITSTLGEIMATIAELQAAVARTTDAEDSVLVLLKGISQQLKDAQGDPAAIADVVAKLDASTAKLAAAVVENTPAA